MCRRMALKKRCKGAVYDVTHVRLNPSTPLNRRGGDWKVSVFQDFFAGLPQKQEDGANT